MRVDHDRMGVAPSAERPLTICVIGHAGSTHVAARTKCFAAMGHTVLLVTEQRSQGGIAGVTEFVPGSDRTLASRVAVKLLSPLLKALGIEPLHFYRVNSFVRFLMKHRPDIVHVHFAHGPYAWYAGLLGCRPLVVSVMGGDVLFDEQGIHTETTRRLTLELLRQADCITSKSHYLTAVLDRLGGFAHKTERVIWGVSPRTFRRVDPAMLRARFGIGQGRRVILSPRILQPLYRIHLLIEALPHIVTEIPEAVLLVTEYAADPQYRARILDRAAALGISDHVVFCGVVGQDDMPQLYSLAEISIAIPSSDGLPQSLLEAMACGTPNVLGRLPHYLELVRHEHSAYFVDATPDAIAAAVVRLLRDPGLRATISRNGLDIVASEGNLDEEARRIVARYRELIARVPARACEWPRLWNAWRF